MEYVCVCVCVEVASKSAEDLIKAITTFWFRLWGSPELFIFDGEGGIDSEEARVRADRWATELIIRPQKKGMGLRKHNDLLRRQMHRSVSQLRGGSQLHARTLALRKRLCQERDALDW